MPLPQDPIKFAQMLLDLGVTPAAIKALHAASGKEAQALLETLKSNAKLRYRKLAFELHPDRNPGDTMAAEKFAQVSNVYQQILEMQAPAAVPVQVAPAIKIVMQKPRQVTRIYDPRAVPLSIRLQRAGVVATMKPKT